MSIIEIRPKHRAMGSPMDSIQGENIFSEDFIDKLWGDHSLSSYYSEILGEGEGLVSSQWCGV